MKRGDWKYIIGGVLFAPLAWAFFYIVFGAGGW
jgi:hypothetical protein